MKSRLVYVAVTVLSGSAALVAPGLVGVAQAGQGQTARVSSVPVGSASLGGVLRGLDGKPLRGICVTAAQGTVLRGARTGPGGRYLIGGLPAGAYLVGYQDCAHPGRYLDQWYGGSGRVSLLAGEATRVLVSASRPAWLGSLRLRSANPGVLRATAKDALARIAALAAGHPGRASARRPEVSGVVRTAAGKRIARECVTVQATGGDQLGIGLETSADGGYSLSGLPRGRRWTVGFSASCGFGAGAGNYAPQWWRYVTTARKATVLRIGSGSPFTGIDARLVKGASLSGVVRASSAHGHGIGRVCVSAYGLGPMSQVTGDTTTKANGAYLMTGLGTGRYQVTFDDCGAKRSYVSTVYPSSVAVTDGKVHAGVDAVMQLAGTISGTVTGPGGVPLHGVCVFAFASLPGSGLAAQGDVGEVGSGRTGHYTVRDLTPGRFMVSFGDCGPGSYAPQYYRGAAVDAGATAVVVRAGQHVTGINARMRPGGTISGLVTNSTGQPLSGICVSVTSEQTAAGLGPSPIGVLIAQFEEIDQAVGTSHGQYRITNLTPGRYQVSFSPGCGRAGAGYAPQWFSPQGGDAADWLSVPGGAPLTGVDARLRRQATISGVVTDKAGKPAAGICAIAFPLSGQPDSQNEFSGDGSAGRSDRAGRYQITDLAGGQYTVAYVSCDRPRYPVNWYPDANTQSSARPVTVADAHATTGIDQVVVAGSTVSGQLLAGKDAAPGVRFCVLAVEAGGLAAAQEFTGKTGSFRIGPLAPGRYALDLFACGARATTLAGEAISIRVPGGSAQVSIAVLVPKAGLVSGTVLGGSPAARVAGLCAEAIPLSQPGLGGTAFTGSRGRYTISGLAPGRYRILLTAQCDGGAGGFASQKLAQTVQVTSGSVRAGVDGTLPADGGIAGTAKVSGTPVAGVCAIAYPVNGRGAPAVAVTGAVGQYQLTGLASGRYLVEFTVGCGTASFTTQWFDQVSAKGSATPVRVRAGLVTSAIDAN